MSLRLKWGHLSITAEIHIELQDFKEKARIDENSNTKNHLNPFKKNIETLKQLYF